MDVALPIAGLSRPDAPDLAFLIEDAGVLEHAAVPTLRFALRVESPGGVPIRSLALGVELRIGATRRRYDRAEQEALAELFGPPAEWGRSLRTLHWTSMTVNVPPFVGATTVELPVTCTYDLEVTAARYLHALADGDVPLEFLFSGSVFYSDREGRLQVARIGWDREAGYRLPVAVWRELIDRHFRGTAWLRVSRETFERLHAFRGRGAHLTWDAAIDALLEDR